MRAVKQGELDALCGIYALINALEVTGVTGPRSPMHKQLFRRLTLGLPADRLQAAMFDGLDSEDLLETGSKAFRWLGRRHRIRVSLERPWHDTDFTGVEAYIDQLRQSARRSDTAVIVNVHLPGYSHWSVVRRFEGKRALLRDSGPLRQLELERFSLDRGRYRFSSIDTLLLTQSTGSGSSRLRPDLRQQI